MSGLAIVLLVFAGIELLNVLTLYFNPGSRLGNGVGIFDAWEKSKEHPEIHDFIKYLVYWVAGAKLIFIALLLVLAFTAPHQTQVYVVMGLIVSIASFFWRLFPLLRKMDNRGNITPKNYSIGLGIIIVLFLLMFAVTLWLNF